MKNETMVLERPVLEQKTTFVCVDCGTKYTIKNASTKQNVSNPKYCKYCY